MIRLRNIIISGFILAVLSIQTLCAQSDRTDYRDTITGGVRMGINYSDVYAVEGEAFSF